MLIRAAVADIRASLGLDGTSRVFVINTEGATDPQRYAELVGQEPGRCPGRQEQERAMTAIDAERLLGRIRELGAIGRDGDGRLVRLAGSDADRQGRDQLVAWIEAGRARGRDRSHRQYFRHLESADNAGQAPLLHRLAHRHGHRCRHL